MPGLGYRSPLRDPHGHISRHSDREQTGLEMSVTDLAVLNNLQEPGEAVVTLGNVLVHPQPTGLALAVRAVSPLYPH